jgi:hypothetical protein
MNPNPDCKLTDFSKDQLRLTWMSLEAAKSLGLWKNNEEEYNTMKTQVMSAYRTVFEKEKVNQN